MRNRIPPRRGKPGRGGPATIIGAILGGALALAMAPATVAEDAPMVAIASLEWPPFSSPRLLDFGATSQIIREAFAGQGVRTRLSFNAWPVSIDMARKGFDDIVGYYPGYHCRHRAGFVPSAPVGSSPLGFAERVDAPIHWQSLDDLGEQRLKIGTVSGYTNTEEFDRRVGTGWIRAIPSDNDTENLQKLLRGRIDAAVIDAYVFRYLVSTEPTLERGRQELQFNPRPIAEAKFYLCFRDDDEGRRMRAVFNEGLQSLDIEKMMVEYMGALEVPLGKYRTSLPHEPVNGR